MPKSKRKVSRAVSDDRVESSTMKVKPWVRWIAIGIILALASSVLAGAITSAPAQAVESSASPSVEEIMPIAEVSCLLDNDNDGVANPDDPDIDGDGAVNGEDDDIDGDKILNGEDGDPAATNCGKNAPPPVILPEPENSSTGSDSSWIAIVAVALLGFGYLVLRRVRASKK